MFGRLLRVTKRNLWGWGDTDAAVALDETQARIEPFFGASQIEAASERSRWTVCFGALFFLGGLTEFAHVFRTQQFPYVMTFDFLAFCGAVSPARSRTRND